ncbi:phosphatase PAP2 family protein [Streptomyces corynorhini]|uniref:PAP2 family protein n=1 Tax=Streptomyces corynorhini TaxID=2282652 RepID=A0A370BF06_9ACTN|nr:phosphatase PAP2 family protein [Streptomyces corynorhini]RDG38286.1 PAP2 family protein [Streptomyces corynorhini]
MRDTPRSQETAGDAEAGHPQRRFGRAFAHTTGATGSGSPHRSDGRPPQTPRGVRHTGPNGRPGTPPPVPGRPFSLSWAGVLALCAVLFALVTWQATARGPLRGADERLGHALAGRGPEPLTQFLSDLGGMPVALPVLAVVIGYTLWRGGRRERGRALAVCGAMAAVPALVVPLKLWIDRRGPLTDATGYYPSGHTATAMVAYGGAALLLVPYAGRRATLPVAGALTLATGTGLVLRGYHWPLDVLGSVLLCGALLLVLGRVLRSAPRRSVRPGRTEPLGEAPQPGPPSPS